MPTTKRKETGRHRKYEHNKLLEATAAETHDGRPSLVLEDRLYDRLKEFHYVDKKGDIHERPQEPPGLPPGLPPEQPPEEK